MFKIQKSVWMLCVCIRLKYQSSIYRGNLEKSHMWQDFLDNQVEHCVLSFGWFHGIWILCADILEHSVPKCRHIKLRCHGIPKERIQHTKQGWTCLGKNITGVLISPWPDLLPSIFCLMVRMFRLMPVLLYVYKKLRGLSPWANYTDRAAAAGRRS